VQSVRIGKTRVPHPARTARRIVLIGDTGCRLKAASDAWQACNEPGKWPFDRVARAAAAMHPDLVVHVGDYHYRENACPPDVTGCRAAAWGYGWDAWSADFFQPAAPLLAAAPWIMVRGNHESCDRAGQGWWLLLDPHPLRAGQDCADPASDFTGNHTAPYAVELGAGSRLIVTDFSAIGEKPLSGEHLARYRSDAERVRALAVPGRTNFVTSHYPFGAVTMGGDGGLHIGNAAIGDAFGAANYVPDLPHVTAMLAGHVHILQYSASDRAPVQIVTGFSGTAEDPAAAPATIAALQRIPGGEDVRDIVSRFGEFGFGLLERKGRTWQLTAYRADGRMLLRRLLPKRG